MGIVFTAIVFTASLSALLFNGKPVEEKKFLGVFLAGNALFLCIPMIIWNQTNGWIAGFSNFVVSALALLGYFMIVFRDRKDYKPGIAAGAGCLVFGLAMQLFIENLTVFFAAFSLCLVIYTFKRYGKSAVDIYMLFLGNLIGAVIMFNNNIYSSLWNTGYAIDGYRHMVYDRSQSFGVFLSDALYRYLVEFIPGTISFDVLLEAFIAILCLLIVLKKMKAKSKDLTPVVAKVFIALDALYAVYYVHIKMLGFPAFVLQTFLGRFAPLTGVYAAKHFLKKLAGGFFQQSRRNGGNVLRVFEQADNFIGFAYSLIKILCALCLKPVSCFSRRQSPSGHFRKDLLNRVVILLR